MGIKFQYFFVIGWRWATSPVSSWTLLSPVDIRRYVVLPYTIESRSRASRVVCVPIRKPEASILKVCVLASSSSGNSIFIGTERTRILIDAGLSKRDIVGRLAAIGEDAEKLEAILVTHEHSDHVSGLVPIAKHSNAPIFATQLTARTIPWGDFEPKLDAFRAGMTFLVGDIEVDSFTVPHDAADPVGFCFRTQGVKIGVVTDLGYITDSIRFHLRGTELLILESNHDLDMLRDGPYPWSVRQRIMGRMGHLSNNAACDFIKQDLDTSISTLILGHLSEHTNLPAKVHWEATQALSERGLFGPRLVVAEPKQQTEVFTY